MTGEKGRPPRHTGDDDVALDRALRKKDAGHEGPGPCNDATAPGDNGKAPSDIDVAMPGDYRDPWKKDEDERSKKRPRAMDEK